MSSGSIPTSGALPVRPGPTRASSDYAASSKQARTPGYSSSPNPHGSQSLYFPGDGADGDVDEEPEMTESSVGATIRLVHRYLELREIVGMWNDFRHGIPTCEETDWLSAYYTDQVSRSFNFVRRAYSDIQQMRSCGYGTPQPSSLEKGLAVVIERVDGWRSKHLKTQMRRGARPQMPTAPPSARNGAGPGQNGEPPSPSSKSQDNSMLMVKYSPQPSRQTSTDGMNKRNHEPSPPPNRVPLNDNSGMGTGDPPGMGMRDQPSKEDMLAQARKMISFMDCVSQAVQEFKMTSEQANKGIKGMREVLLKLQKEAILEMKHDAEMDKNLQQGGNMQIARRN